MESAASNSSTSSSPLRVSSPNAAQSRRPSPWSQIVRGGESEPPTISAAAATAPSSPQSKPPIESASSSPSTVVPGGEKPSEESGKKPVWKRPSNGSSSEIAPVMGGAVSSWPALSETTKAPSNKSSSDSLKSLGGGGDAPSSSSAPVSQGIAHASVPAPKQAGRANHNPTPNQTRQRSFNKRNGASGSVANGTVSQPSAHGSFAEMPLHNPSPRGQNQRNGFASQPHGGSENQSQRDSYRNQNGNHHQNHGRRNQEHGNQNWSFNRSFNGRDGNAQSQRGGAPAFVRHAPPPVQPIPPQFIAAQPIPPFGSPMPFPPDMVSPYYPRMPFLGPLSPAPVFYRVPDAPVQDAQLPLPVRVQNQIHFYFSDDNLSTDPYLRGLMDDQGFVSLHTIAAFNKVIALKANLQQIVEALQGSPFVEVQGDRIRKRHNWQHWLPPPVAVEAVANPAVAVEAVANPAVAVEAVANPAVPVEAVANPAVAVEAVANRVGNLALGGNSADLIGGSSSNPQPAETENEAGPDGLQQTSSGGGGVDPASNRNGSDGPNH